MMSLVRIETNHGYHTMILTSVGCIMICHARDKSNIFNHDLARLTMIMAAVPLLGTLGRISQIRIFSLLHDPLNIVTGPVLIIVLVLNPNLSVVSEFPFLIYKKNLSS